jgi:hypothetical protein
LPLPARIAGPFHAAAHGWPRSIYQPIRRLFIRIPVFLFSYSPPYAKEGCTMKTLQKWFEQLAGISEYDYAREARMADVFRAAPLDTAGLEIPACWRRNGRSSHHRCAAENRRKGDRKDHLVG